MIEPKGYADKNGAMQKFYAAARAYRKAYDRLGLIEHLPSHELRADQATKDRLSKDEVFSQATILAEAARDLHACMMGFMATLTIGDESLFGHALSGDTEKIIACCQRIGDAARSR